MNEIWSKYIQGIKTLYSSRKLRFDDIFSEQYKSFFDFDENKPIKILEVGCGPGALAEALHRWYPLAEITAIDRDSNFISYAKENIHGVKFVEGDATALPFDDNTFDVTISNTVSEHIEPSKFYGEQRRVLKHNGVCIVLSSRKGINISPTCFTYNKFEKEFWDKVNQFDNTLTDYSVCQYPMNEAELPLAMQKYGFCRVSTGYATVDLTPDNPRYEPAMAHDMINSIRYSTLESVESVLNTMPDHFTEDEVSKMKQITNERFDSRIADYNAGKKYWETNLSIIMMVCGIKV